MSKRAAALFLALVASSGLALGQATPEPPRPPKPPRPPRDATAPEAEHDSHRGPSTFDQKASFVAKGVIEIENFTGSVKVTGWDRNEIAGLIIPREREARSCS